ncbi:hypothetical protein L7F22_010379 [Adiantum nelumboides]|nr:hypothetical protein [Adiantum nelumboides]
MQGITPPVATYAKQIVPITKKLLTLAIVNRGGQVLLGLKKRGFGEGYYNGFGGKVEVGETIEEAARREPYGCQMHWELCPTVRIQFWNGLGLQTGEKPEIPASCNCSFWAGIRGFLSVESSVSVENCLGSVLELLCCQNLAKTGVVLLDTDLDSRNSDFVTFIPLFKNKEIPQGAPDLGANLVSSRIQLQEEAGIVAGSIMKQGVLTFHFDDKPQPWEVHVFNILDYCGQPCETDEMSPQWFLHEEIPFSKMWKDDEIWYPHFLAGKLFKGEFYFCNTHHLDSYKFGIVPEL